MDWWINPKISHEKVQLEKWQRSQLRNFSLLHRKAISPRSKPLNQTHNSGKSEDFQTPAPPNKHLWTTNLWDEAN